MIGETLLSASCHTPRLTRLAVFAVAGATALSVAACGSSNKSASTSTSTSTSTTTSTTTAPAPAQGEAKVSGLIASVAGNSIQVTKEDNTNAAVNFTASTKILEMTPASLSDVTMGSCVTVRPVKEETQGNQPVTAASVKVSPAVNGTCPQPEKPPAGSSSPAPPPGSPAPAPPKPIRGAVSAVTGNTINIAGSDASGNTQQTAVMVDDKTKYTKQVSAASEAITQGKCLNARGTMDNAGALQATSIKLRPAKDGKCAGPGKQPGHGG